MLLPPANEVWGKVIFLHLFVILFTGGEVPDQVHPRDQVHPPEQTPPGSRPLRDQVHPLGADTPPGPGTPLEQAPPLQDQVHPPDQVPPRHQVHPQSRHPPWPGTPPAAEHAGRYGQCAGGPHPTGMQSCFESQRTLPNYLVCQNIKILHKICIFKYTLIIWWMLTQGSLQEYALVKQNPLFRSTQFVKCSLVPNFLKQPPHSIFSCNYKPGGWPHFRGENSTVNGRKFGQWNHHMSYGKAALAYPSCATNTNISLFS